MALVLLSIDTAKFFDATDDGAVHGNVIIGAFDRTVTDFNWKSASFYLDHRRIIEMLTKAFVIDRGRRDDDFQITALGDQPLDVPQQEINIQAPFMGFIDNQRVILFEQLIPAGFRKQHAIGEQFDPGTLADLVLEAHLIANQVAQLRLSLLSNPRCNRASRQTAWLGMSD